MVSAQELSQIVYWHRELPPMQADPVGERTIRSRQRARAGHHRPPR